jgi:hypothetical protein
MSTTTHNSDRSLVSMSADEDQYKAVDELFAQLGNKTSLDPAVPVVRQITQLPSPTDREPLLQRSAVPLSQWRPVSAIYADHDEPTWVDRLQQVMLVGCLVLAAMALVKALPASWSGSDNLASAALHSTPSADAGVVGAIQLESMPIKKVQVGDRIAGSNPIREQAEGIEPDPAIWRKISLHMRKESGLSLWIDLLRPREWVENVGARPGATIFLDLFDMGAIGDAEVTDLGPCPPIKPGNGTVVTGKFIHQADANSNVIRLRVEGQKEPTSVTSNHPYWSEDRKEYVEVGRLRIGELVNTEFGVRRVESVTPYSDYSGLLYNLETTEHVYRVGSLGTLVHNACAIQPYGGPGGGHHIFSKKAFEGVPGYDLNRALAIPQSEIARLELNHLRVGGITQTQRRLFSELAASGRPNTLAEHARIARESLIAGGLSRQDAASVVRTAMEQLRSWGITAPSIIPWN